MNQIEYIMALADEYAWAQCKVGDYGEAEDIQANVDTRQALRAAIEQALTPGEPVATWENTYGMKEWQVHALRAGWWPQPKQEPVEKRDLLYATVAMQEREAQRIENIVGTLEQIKQEKLAMLAAAPQPQLNLNCKSVQKRLAEQLGFAPQQREWVGLTDEEINDVFANRDAFANIDRYDFAKDIEAKLRERNGGNK